MMIALAIAAAVLLVLALWSGWRFWWFWRDPRRTPPDSEGLVSPADGTVVYVRRVEPGEDVIVIKQGLAARVSDIVREDVDQPKIVIGIFMSPFDVHFNRAPLRATVRHVARHPGRGPNRHMGSMHWRTLTGRRPLYRGSEHVVQNERTVTRFDARYRDTELPFYVVQIGARTVNGIDSFCAPGETVERGEKFGMIRIGSQVDLIVPDRPSLEILVAPGNRVRGGESVLIR